MEIVPYSNTFREQCLAVFDSNCPEFFLKEERAEFEFWIDNEIKNGNTYWVGFKENQIVACAGIYLADEKFGRAVYPNEVGFAWGMVASEHHQSGFGREFSIYRINYLNSHYPDRPVVLRTTQKTYSFFERMGFKVLDCETDGYGEGFDKITMILRPRLDFEL